MPVPGTLRRRPIDKDGVSGLLSRQFNLPKEETLAYLKLLDTQDLTVDQISEALGIKGEKAEGLVADMVGRGLVIEAIGTPRRYAPLHPRMVLTNLFKAYEKEVVQTLRDRRATVDRIVNLLIPVYEERETRSIAERKD